MTSTLMIGLDIGTTGARAVLVDDLGEIIQLQFSDFWYFLESDYYEASEYVRPEGLVLRLK